MSESRFNERESLSRAKLVLLQEVGTFFSENPERVFELEGKKPKKGIYENWAICRTPQDIMYRIDVKKELEPQGTIRDFSLTFTALNHDVLSYLHNQLIEGFVVIVRKNPIDPVHKKFKCFGTSLHTISGRPLLEPIESEMGVYEIGRFTEQIRASSLLFDEEAAEITKNVARTPSAKTFERMVRRVLRHDVEY